MAAVRCSGGAARPTAPTSEVMPVPATPMPSNTPLISRSAPVWAANIRYMPIMVASAPVTTTRPAP